MTGIERRIFLALFLFSLLVRIAMVALNPPAPSTTLTPLNDSTDYHHLALSILDFSYSSPGGEPTAFRAPVYPIFLASIYFISGKGNLVAVALFQALLGAVSVWLIARIAFMLWRNIWYALITGIIASIYPAFIFQTSLILTEVLHRFLQLLFLFVLLKAIKEKSINRMFFAGLLAGISILSKSVLLLVFPLLCIWVWYVLRSENIWRRRAVIFFTIGGVIIVGGWTTRNFLISGEFIPVSTNFPITFAQGVTRFSFYTNKWFGSER
ncbi:glycosyltransferase family 39 protein, partial [Candidatus Sumerlaeota bacterium]|nr:glycosyltransferase family 39 protein [Candidatus Sumerlaeota bacterium]